MKDVALEGNDENDHDGLDELNVSKNDKQAKHVVKVDSEQIDALRAEVAFAEIVDVSLDENSAQNQIVAEQV